MFRHAICFCALFLTVTAAQAQTAKSYFGASAILDAKLDYNHPSLSDVAIDNGFILSYGRQTGKNAAIEVSYVRYLDMSGYEGLVTADVTAIEVSGLFFPSDTGPYVRIGYSDGDLSSRVGDLTQSESESGPLIGIGVEIPIQLNSSAVRLEFTSIEYDNAEAERLTLGTLIRF